MGREREVLVVPHVLCIRTRTQGDCLKRTRANLVRVLNYVRHEWGTVDHSSQCGRVKLSQG